MLTNRATQKRELISIEVKQLIITYRRWMNRTVHRYIKNMNEELQFF